MYIHVYTLYIIHTLLTFRYVLCLDFSPTPPNWEVAIYMYMYKGTGNWGSAALIQDHDRTVPPMAPFNFAFAGCHRVIRTRVDPSFVPDVHGRGRVSERAWGRVRKPRADIYFLRVYGKSRTRTVDTDKNRRVATNITMICYNDLGS